MNGSPVPRIRVIEPSCIGDIIHIGTSVNLGPWTAENYYDELKNPNAVMLRLVSDENKTIGFIVGRVVTSSSEGVDAEIYNVAVKESEQQKGNGQILFEAFIEQCLKRKATTIWLEVRESNRKAISFYARNGFETLQRRSNFYNNPREHALVMRLDLSTDRA